MKKAVSTIILISLCISLTGCAEPNVSVDPYLFTSIYEQAKGTGSSYLSDYEFKGLENSEEFLYRDICFTTENVISSDYEFTAASAACFDVDNASVIYAKDIYKKVYPASTTKLLTALMAVKYADPDEIVTVAKDNAGITIVGAQLCGFKAGDTVTMRDLLYCLLLFSGNDAAVAIAEHISGSVSEFCKLMNSEAALLGATDTHFTNPHGLHDINHYTTAYDIYLIFNECLRYSTITEIFGADTYDAVITGADGSVRKFEVQPTNMYRRGMMIAPKGMKVIGGKTGETIAAGNCLVIYSKDENGHGYITELFKSKDRPTVYNEMNVLLDMCEQ